MRSWPEVHAKLARSSYEVGPKFDPFSFHPKTTYHMLAYVRSWPKFVQCCLELYTKLLQTSKIDQVFFRSSCEACPKLVRSLPEVRAKLVHSWPEVRLKLARSSCEVGPKFVRSRCTVGPKFVRSWPEVRPKLARSWFEVRAKLARSFVAKFASKWKHIFCAYRMNIPKLIYEHIQTRCGSA